MLLTLFFTFAKIGAFTFGGGYAMISLIENICVEQKKWITHDEMVNMATYVGSTPAFLNKAFQSRGVQAVLGMVVFL